MASKSFYEQFCYDIPLEPTTLMISTYTGETFQPLGQANFNVNYTVSQIPVDVPQGSCALFARKTGLEKCVWIEVYITIF